MDTLPGSRIGRIRIDAVLGAGGMGTVYRGFDEGLERPVALKRIHSDKRRSPALRARFRREARVLSKLDHPNICRIYDLIEADDADYLVLELIDGATLRQRIESLPRQEALRIALQVVRVLELAHGHGIIHRDLKPENVMITPAGEVKVLDYGLARLVDRTADGEAAAPVDFDGVEDISQTVILGADGVSTEGDLTQTFTGTLVGTLHYMSPEQARGLPLSAASDMYSLGVMLAEMLGDGISPYGSFISNADLLQRVRSADLALPPLHDRDLDRLLASLTSLQPSARPSAAETRAVLELVLARPALKRRRLQALGAAVAIGVVVLAGVIAGRTFFAAPSLLGGHGQMRIAVMPIRNATGDRGMQWIEMGLGGVVADAVGRTRGVDVVAPDAVAEAMNELKITDPEKQRRVLLNRLGADVVVTSTAARTPDGIVTIRYVVGGRESAESARTVSSSVPTEAAAQMATQLVQRIDPHASVRDRYSFDSVANMLYAMGFDAQRRTSQAVATHYFTVCLDRDPDFVAARLRLATSQRLLGEAAEAQRNFDRALEQARAKNDRDMVATALATRARWHVDSGDYAGAQRDATEAVAVATAAGNLRLRAEAQNSLATVAWRQHQLDRAKALFNETLRTFAALRSPRDEAKIYNNLGVVEDSLHNLAAARAMYQQSLAISERINDRLLITSALGNLASIYGEENDFARAEAMTRRQLALARDVGDKPTEVLAGLNLGLWVWSQGRDDEGIRFTNDALTAARKLGAKPVEALLLSNLATAKARLGDIAGAVRDGDAAMATIRGVDDPEISTDVFLGNAYALIRAGRLDEAQRLIDRAEHAAPGARCKIIRARLAYARGAYAEAHALITAAKNMHQVWPLPYEEMLRAFEESARSGRPSSIPFEKGS